MRTLEEVAARYGLSLIYLFGSQVDAGLALLRGERVSPPDALTDIDVGVVFKGGLPELEKRTDVYAGIYNDLEELFRPFRLDLCFLEENHSVFQCSVLSGANIYSSAPDVRFDYEVDIARRGADFRPVLERYLEEILEEV